MKFLSTVALLTASASATNIKARQLEPRPVYSSYELSLVAPGADYDGGAVTLKDGKLGFYGSAKAEPITIGVYDYYDEEGPAGQVVRTEQSAVEPDPFVALAGQPDDGLRDLVTTEVELEAGGAFGFSHNEEDEDDFLFDVRWVPEAAAPAGGESQAWAGEEVPEEEAEGQWKVASVGENEWELSWYDGTSFTTANVFPVRLVGRLTAQS